MKSAALGVGGGNNSLVSYIVYQREECPTTGRKHYQGYIELTRSCELKTVLSLFKCKCHLEPRKGSQAQAIEYCTKEDTKIEEPVKCGKPKMQGSRSDLDSINDAILCGKTPAQILIEFGGNALRHIGHIKSACTEIWGLDGEVSSKIREKKSMAKCMTEEHLLELLKKMHE